MFRSIDRSPRRRNRAVTLIEAVLYISIALALIVGGLVFFQQASTAAKTSATVRQLSAVMAESRILLKGMPPTTQSSDVTPMLISAGAVPQDMVVSPTVLSNAFGGTTRFYTQFNNSQQIIVIRLTNVPQGVCARLLTATGGSEFTVTYDVNTGQLINGGTGYTTMVSSEHIWAAVRVTGLASSRSYVMNATEAGWMCKYGSHQYFTKTTEPSNPPLSGNVEVQMALRLVY